MPETPSGPNSPHPELAPLLLKLAGRPVLVVGGGTVAAAKVPPLVAAGAEVRVVAPDLRPELVRSGARLERRPFLPADLDGVWLAVAAATPEVNRAVVAEAERRRIFVDEAAPRGPRPEASAPSSGFVSLVGAGPGDPELLTVKAVKRLAAADLVLYDALVSGEALRYAQRAHCFFVGKRAGRPSVKQETIHRMLVQAARAGKRVVRLKAGDPFVFGRGGEEVQALAEAGVPHEVIPGLSSALAAPALAGIPLTHRGLVAGFTVVSGHAEEAYRPIITALRPGAATLVVLMGVGTRARLTEVLRLAGWSGSTPAAAVLGAATPEAFTWTGTLAELPAAPLDGHRAPGTLVIGEVVRLATATTTATATATAAPPAARAEAR